MWRHEVLRGPVPADRDVVLELVDHVQARTGRRPLSDARWVELHGGSATGVLASDGDRPVAWAQFAPGHDGWTIEVVADPSTVALDGLIDRALAEIGHHGGGRVRWWTFDDAAARWAADNGFHDERGLHQMQIDLPLAEHTDVATRPFRVGHDEAAWLTVNNAAFGWHPEQGGWDLATVEAREAEPWFDPDGFLLHDDDQGRLVAFCWTKIHHDLAPVTGEIYVIAVHPDAHGRGLGRALTLAGLQHIAAQGVRRGMLYVDRDNTAAVALYRRLGFTTTRTDLAFVRDVVPPGSTA